ncbi:MAG: tRNA ((37)-N6)-dimethylallyltransferase MiaA [Fibrobacterota bacterium]
MLGGATASGKTTVAVELASRLGLEILGCDSGQIRSGMAIGTAAPTPEEQARVKHHLVGCVDPRANHSVTLFLDAVREILATPGPDLLAVGGTGQFLSSLWRGIDPVPAPDPALRDRAIALWDAQGPEACLAELARLGAEPPRDAQNPQRMQRSLERAWALERGDVPVGHAPMAATAPVFALGWPRDVLHHRIHERLDGMLPAWRKEVEDLKALGLPEEAPGLAAIGYRELWNAPDGPLAWGAVERIAVATRQYAKRQETWLRTQLPSRWIVADGDLESTVGQILSGLV